MGNPIVKIGNNSPQKKLLFPLHDVDPHLIYRCLVRPHTPPQTAALMKVALQTPHWLQLGTPHSPPKLPLPMDRLPNRTTCLIAGPIGPTIPHSIHIQSAVLPQCTRKVMRKVWKMTCTNRPHML